MAEHPAGAGFPTTRWTLILSCREAPERHREALAELLRSYWQPLYVFLRKRGLSPSDAEDAVQGFAARMLESNLIARLDPGRGRLRAYLKTALQHHVQNLHVQAVAEKRGGGAVTVALDVELAERLVEASPESPEAAYQRAWAAAVFERALGRLREEHQAARRAGPFEVIESYFQGQTTASYAELAERHDLSIPQLKSLLHRARARFRELVRAEVAETVVDPAEVDGEMGELLRAL